MQLVAEDLLQNFGNDMRNLTVVMPSRRASTFLLRELSLQSEKPVWAPECITIGEMFQQLSPYREADSITTICMLYEQYIRHVGPQIEAEEGPEALDAETLDRFWGWGEVLLADMDDIDKHLADAHAIFTVIREDEELKRLDYLTEEQQQVLQRFLGYTVDRGTQLKRRFMRLWEQMNAIYTALNEQQKEQGERYQGALYRDVCERLDEIDLSERWADVCFVGFNVLNSVEHSLMSACKSQTRARFYWDYDVFYTRSKNTEAGAFMQQNLQDFPSALPPSEFDNLRHLRDVTFIACSTDNAQARYVGEWIKTLPITPSLGNEDSDNSTPTALSNNREKWIDASAMDAAVLCNEHLLSPVMHVIPPTVTANVTMGFPLTETPVFGFLSALVALQTDGYDAQRQRFRYTFQQVVQRHPYSRLLEQEEWLTYASESPLTLLSYLRQIVRRLASLLTIQQEESPLQPQEGGLYNSQSSTLFQLHIEAAYRLHAVLSDFIALVERTDNPLSIGIHALRRLLRQVLGSVSIPFHSDPDRGLQVMGVLETRCLDFNNLLMIAVEEDKLPKQTRQLSVIPPHIRQAFRLTTEEHKIAIYSYYFYRLIQRAQRLTCVYNDNSVGLEHHEMSRFLRQLQAETDILIHYHRLVAEPDIIPPTPLSVPRTEALQERLLQRYTSEDAHPLSPSAINRYLRCPLMFYFQDIARIRVERDVQDGIDPSLMGTIFHDSAQAVYTDIMRRNHSNVITAESLTTLLQHSDGLPLRPYVDAVFDAHYFHPIEDDAQRMEHILQMIAEGTQPNIVWQGEDIIIRDVLVKYLRHLLLYDLRRTPFRIVGMEQDVHCTIPVSIADGALQIITGGRVDRMDEKDGVLRIVDYKTGRHHDELKTLEQLFERGSKHPGYYMQTLLYAMAVSRSHPDQPIHAALLYPALANQKEYDPSLQLGKQPMGDLRSLLPDFHEQLTAAVADIFSAPSFEPTDDASVCAYCDFCALCGRN